MVDPKNLDAGDSKFDPGNVITEESDGTGTRGDMVKYDGNGQLTPCTAQTDDWVGLLAETPGEAGEGVSVRVGGVGVAKADDGNVSAGDILVLGDSDATRLTSDGGRYQAVDEGGTATYNLAVGQIQALGDSSQADDLIVVKLP